MGGVHSKLLIVTTEFTLYKQGRSSIRGICNAVNIIEVEKNLEIKKTTIEYPDTNSTKEGNVTNEQLNNLESHGVEWSCVKNEEANNRLREKLENTSIIIVTDKVTQDLLQNFVDRDVTFIVR